ncbi:cytochrome c oxidase accessory protein CcoG [Kingella kingae]|uniref:cytochrome c oxidase accessory protein CcoG n=1 Tax=Kingella kingae TaxID=504 RepID=UPI000420CBDD|nr:cytochrome c oxidase accessory protein CcoG [Kingella kingae]MDK4563711.1 cytochrome c oxidase accessory protein CcoG [Kingella kingae]MDK4577581.1 cytochrome c oxidase accessory protein CcoG [Kingella kingae]MDK4608105.1 cytochrome c oxidase accessory protein CcoG [Kingella kingae]MDK4626094.1 cytochrome c oxidase accessory protein CcoG [Kingella kingae]MDK4673810.1 cytochrome c oxidase accessory protein CcoG [Kingella kingae]
MSTKSPKKPPVKEQTIQLYQGAKRIHPKLAKGRFANIRIFMIVATQLFFYGMPWISWDGRQAVWFDILGRHFYIFSLVFEPADLLYLTGLLIVSAFGLFWWTTVAGRLWCGYSCPQTVYTEIMLWIDHLVEGDRNKRLKLDKEPWNARKIRIKAIKYTLIFVVAAWTGITFAGWFTPIRDFVPAIFNGTAGSVALGTAAFYGMVTWLFGHIMREQVCLHMCPYARFQSAMFDHDTLVISYDEERGEPRGARKKNAEHNDMGDCINCTACVQVCPTGIDIRDGLQYQCIGCAACIDACDEIMDKMGYPRGLIRYTTEAVLKHEYTDADIKKHLLRPKVVGYGGMLLAAIIALLVGIATRQTMQIDVIKDRGVMVRENKEGMLENAYNLSISNASDKPQIVTADVTGFKDIRLTGLPENGVLVPAGQIITVPVQVATQPEYADKGSHPIVFTFHYRTEGQPATEARDIEEQSIFIGE